MHQSCKHLFINDLIMLAKNQSPTLQKIREIKAAAPDDSENVKDPIYLANACAALAAYLIRGIDHEYISFGSDSERMQYYWLIQILVDVAVDGQLEQLFLKDKPTLTIVGD